ncbi:ring finger containing protein [Trypanosoma equiperdum]|uniref:RING-type E3 ubiquitin transferase n=1 Tax=Trypanosoma equiperdum TaxID=5694 RepID=A0A1G4IL97_TRYEQ|nr:ring finger containing protein [Trypanosoma equiperdum]
MSRTDFSCAICYEVASEPVVTRCGHLFCWRCLSRWLHPPRSAVNTECPVCRGRVDENVNGDIIPLYGKGRSEGASSSFQRSSPWTQGASHGPPPRPAAARVPSSSDGNSFRLRGAFPFLSSTSFFFFSSDPYSLIAISLLWAMYQLPWREWLTNLSTYLGGVSNTVPTADEGGSNVGAVPSPQRSDDLHSREVGEAITRHVRSAMVLALGLLATSFFMV